MGMIKLGRSAGRSLRLSSNTCLFSDRSELYKETERFASSPAILKGSRVGCERARNQRYITVLSKFHLTTSCDDDGNINGYGRDRSRYVGPLLRKFPEADIYCVSVVFWFLSYSVKHSSLAQTYLSIQYLSTANQQKMEGSLILYETFCCV